MIAKSYLEDGIGCWAERRTEVDFHGRPALFLDRDGVVVEEVHFLSRVEDIRLIAGIADAIISVNRRNLPVVVVTNQSGIAREHFDWDCFAIVQAAITEALAAAGAHFDAVLACGYHPGGSGALGIADHPWRKPNPGMLQRAQLMFGVDLTRSFIIGDRMTDLEAGARAGLFGGGLVMSGYDAGQRATLSDHATRWRADGFATEVFDDTPMAIARFLDNLDACRAGSFAGSGN